MKLLQCRINDDLYDDIERLAKEDFRSITNIVILILTKYVKGKKEIK